MNNVVSLYSSFEIRFLLPAGGEALETCGKYGYKGHYDGESWHYLKHKNNCHRYECPICNGDLDVGSYDGWIKQEAVRITERLVAYETIIGYPIVHYIISPEPGTITMLPDYKKLRTKMLQVAKKNGIWGGVAIFHYFRHPSGLNDRVEICPDNPHWHIVGTGWLPTMSKGDKPKCPGWIVKRAHNGVRRGYGRIYNTVAYCLRWSSNAISLDIDSLGNLLLAQSSSLNFHVSTWFGSMSSRSFFSLCWSPDDDGAVYCPVCDNFIPAADWHTLYWHGMDPPNTDFGIADIGPETFEILIPYAY